MTGKSPARHDAAAAPRDPDVVRGQWASLRTSSGEVTLEARVEVLQDGLQGQNVRVRPAQATQPVVARVIGPGQLEVVR
jgi:flagella basal body P-ring formation protein FlgA